MLEKTGIPTPEQIDGVFPGEARLAKGPVAVIECFERIPCNPCRTACCRDAIQPFADINDRPVIKDENCNGCALCLAKCPGLAIMIVDMTWSADRALLKIPYEFRPLPEKGETVLGLNRAGEPVAPVEVVAVLNTRALDRTPIVSIAVDKAHVRAIRNIGNVGGERNE